MHVHDHEVKYKLEECRALWDKPACVCLLTRASINSKSRSAKLYNPKPYITRNLTSYPHTQLNTLNILVGLECHLPADEAL